MLAQSLKWTRAKIVCELNQELGTDVLGAGHHNASSQAVKLSQRPNQSQRTPNDKFGRLKDEARRREKVNAISNGQQTLLGISSAQK